MRQDEKIWQKIKQSVDVRALGIKASEWQKFCRRIEACLKTNSDAALNKVIAEVDGAARGNPGPAGIGIVFTDPLGGKIREHYEYIGEATNNIAEYRALLKALELAAELGVDDLMVRTDSELLAKQMNGIFRVKNINLLDLYLQAQERIATFRRAEIEQVAREDNHRADRLANLAIEAQRLKRNPDRAEE